MNELLLQTIVEKLGIFETLLKQVGTDKDEINQNQLIQQLQALHAKIEKMNEHFLLNQKRMSELELRMEALNKRLQTPLKNQIDHKHHLHKGIWIAIVSIFISTFFFCLWMNSNDQQKQFEANDIKYRALKATHDKALLQLLYQTDSLYNLDPQHMQEWVAQEEDQLNEQTKMFQLADEKKKERKDLRNRAENK
jgi:hypothetical protein